VTRQTRTHAESLNRDGIRRPHVGMRGQKPIASYASIWVCAGCKCNRICHLALSLDLVLLGAVVDVIVVVVCVGEVAAAIFRRQVGRCICCCLSLALNESLRGLVTSRPPPHRCVRLRLIRWLLPGDVGRSRSALFVSSIWWIGISTFFGCLWSLLEIGIAVAGMMTLTDLCCWQR
jgi:hypothetical protein